ncbi:MAG: hypothetical protein ABIH42_04265 [Planctomycetota bacterium]
MATIFYCSKCKKEESVKEAESLSGCCCSICGAPFSGVKINGDKEFIQIEG